MPMASWTPLRKYGSVNIPHQVFIHVPMIPPEPSLPNSAMPLKLFLIRLDAPALSSSLCPLLDVLQYAHHVFQLNSGNPQLNTTFQQWSHQVRFQQERKESSTSLNVNSCRMHK